MEDKTLRKLIKKAARLEKKHARLVGKIYCLSAEYDSLIKEMIKYAPEEQNIIDEIKETFGLELKKEA